MADITKCSGKDCPIKEKCYRYNALESKHQSYFMVTPYNHREDKCDHYWGK